jgi:hypothetical protein
MKSLPAGIIAPVVVATAGYAGGGESASMKPKVDPGRGWGTGVGTFSSSTIVSAGHGTIEMTLTQSGSQATGDLRVTGLFDPSGPIQVTVSGNTAHIIQPSKLTGTVTVQGGQHEWPRDRRICSTAEQPTYMR